MRSTNIPRDDSAPALGREFVRRALRSHPDAAATAELVVSELITNAVLHETGSEAPLSLAVETSPEAARVSVGLTHKDRFEMRQTPGGVDGGFGLRIVKALSSRWGMNWGSVPAVWAEIPLGNG